jgi:DNA-binding MarR family transcriptional regulator
MRQLLLAGEGHRQLLRACNGAGLTPGLLKMSMHLSTDTPQPMRDLAQRLQCDASYVTSVVDGLEQHGIAERRPHPSDRRVKTVVLTDHGAEVLARVNAVLDEPPPAFDVLNEAEQIQLRDLLRRVVAAQEPVFAPSAEPQPVPPADTSSVPPADNSPVPPAADGSMPVAVRRTG